MWFLLKKKKQKKDPEEAHLVLWINLMWKLFRKKFLKLDHQILPAATWLQHLRLDVLAAPPGRPCVSRCKHSPELSALGSGPPLCGRTPDSRSRHQWRSATDLRSKSSPPLLPCLKTETESRGDFSSSLNVAEEWCVCSGFTPHDLNFTLCSSPSERKHGCSVCLFVGALVAHLFAGESASAENARLSSPAPPGTSGSSPSDKPCHSWSLETVHTNICRYNLLKNQTWNILYIWKALPAFSGTQWGFSTIFSVWLYNLHKPDLLQPHWQTSTQTNLWVI